MVRHLLRVQFILLFVSGSALAQNASISGFVVDETTGETLLLANVVLRGTQIGTATNTAGYYTIPDIRPGSYTLVCSYLGYERRTIEVDLKEGQALRLDIEMKPENLRGQEVVVSGEREEEEEVRRIGVAQLKTAVVKEVPALLEADVFRSLQLLPGVKAASDYSSGLYIRGGSPDQTLILLDRTTVYNPTHFFGFFSTFNPDAIKDVRLYKGGFPAEYGGRLGSVIDIYNKDGNRRATHGGATVGLLASRVNLEGPYSKGSWMIAARRTTLEPLLAALRGANVDGIPNSFYFVDLNGKVNYDASQNDHVSVAFYMGNDALNLEFLEDALLDIGYGNRTLSTNWTHIFSERLFSNFTFTGSRYFSEPEFSIASTPFKRANNVYDFSAKGDFEYITGDRGGLRGGFWAGLFTFKIRDEFDGIETMNERIQTAYGSVYLQETYRPTTKWMIQGGVRANYFGKGDYFRLEPRFALEYQPDDGLRLQLGGGRYYQFLTLITSELFSGFDIWLTTGDGVPPAYGDQIVGGLKTRVGRFDVDLETYYRTMRRLFELDPFLPDAAGLDYEDLFHFGSGYAYGTELSVRKPHGRLNGFLGYTLSFSRRRFPNLNEFEYYPPKYDRTHDLNLTLNYELGRSWRLTGIFNYATGQAYTKPAAQYRFFDYPLGSQNVEALVSPFNGARLPAYHRLDLGFSKLGRFFNLGDYELQLQVLNAYMRKNIWFYFYDFNDDGSIDREEVPQIPVAIPNVSFTVTF